MALTPSQQAQYESLVSAGASPDAAMQAASQVPTTSVPAPTVPQTDPTQTQQQQPQQQQAPVPTETAPGAPQVSSNLQQGSTGTDVANLQKWLVQQGYLTSDQIAGGTGTYGPKTTAAVAQLQKDLGLTPTTGKGAFGPQTQQALAQKYQAALKSMTGPAPDNSGQAASAVADATQAQANTSTDPVFGAIAAALAPIMSSLTQVMNNINDPALTGISLQQEYNQLAQQNNLPAMQSDLLNMQRIMTGTEDDIRDEISSAGGTATESQVLGMTAARNKVILKQYNSLATQYQAAQSNVQNMMQYAAQDQNTALQRDNMVAGITESMASIESQMMTMGMTMQKNAADNLNKVVTNIGYTGLASQAQGNPQMLSYYENMLSLAPGTLSDPASLAQMETYRQQQLKLGQQRVTIQMYNAGMGQGGVQPQITPDPAGGPSVTQNYSASDLTRPSWLPSNIPLSMTQAQMTQYMNSSSAQKDVGTNNVVAPGIGYYVQQPDGSYFLNSALPTGTAKSAVETQYNQMISAMQKAQSTPVGGSPLNKGRLSRNANTALKAYLDSPVYKNVSSGAVYLSRIGAALTNPGSISDLELADSIIKINNGGGQVTEAQLNTYFQGQSFSDKFNVVGDKIEGKGGVLSPQQRQDLAALAQETFSNYKQQYEQLYVQAGQNLQGQGIPLNYLSNFPDWTSFLTAQ